MPADASIFQNFLRAPKSVQDYDNESMQAQSNALAMKTQQAQYNSLVQQQQQEDAIKNYLGGGASLATPEGQAGLYRVAGSKAGSILKDQSALAKDRAAADKDKTESGLKVWQSYRDQASMIRNPQEAAAWIANGYHDPVIGPYLQRTGSLEEGLSRIPQDQAGFEAWRNGVGMNVDKLAAHALQQRQFDLNANNELIGADGKVNQTLLGAKKQVAQAGAPVQSSVTYQVDGQGNLVALPTKIPSGSGSVSSVPVMSGGQPVQGVGKDKPLPEAAQKQVMGARNLQDAVGGYLAKLQGWSNAKMLSPDQRADMGNAYNNMMLQAKEAYNLGVLNGPDYDILQSVVKDPTKLTSVLTSNEALSDQAKSLRNIAANIEKTALEAHGKKYTPRQTSNLSAQDQQAADWANANPNDPRAAQIKKRLGL